MAWICNPARPSRLCPVYLLWKIKCLKALPCRNSPLFHVPGVHPTVGEDADASFCWRAYTAHSKEDWMVAELPRSMQAGPIYMPILGGLVAQVDVPGPWHVPGPAPLPPDTALVFI